MSDRTVRGSAGRSLLLAAACLTLAGASPPVPRAAPDLFSRLDAYVAREMGPAGDPGAALVVVDARGVVHCRGFGHDVRGAPVTCRTPFAVASLTKAFTAVATMRSVERGSLRLDEPARKYLPGFRVHDRTPIALRDLLQMRAGFSTNEGKRWLAGRDGDDAALDRRVSALGDVPLSAAPGSTFAYSNASYDVLGAILHVRAGTPFARVVEDDVLRPLGIERARVGRDPTLRGYNRWFGVPLPALPAPRDAADDPAAGLVIDAQEYGRFLAAQVDEGRTWSTRVLSRGGWQRLHRSPQDAPYAMGWFDLVRNGSHLYRHDGLAPDFHAFAVFSPADRIGAALFVNASEEPDGGRRDRFDLGIQRLLFGGTPDEQPPVPADVPLRIVLLAGLAGLANSFRAMVQFPRRRTVVPAAAAAITLVAVWTQVLPMMGGSLAVGVAYAPDLGLMLAALLAICVGTLVAAVVRTVQDGAARRFGERRDRV